ncbi:hypothetical protein J3U68_10110 [Snodgrassella sp. B3882]|nr:hypothetical protein [Snodgrassella sp. B3882]
MEYQSPKKGKNRIRGHIFVDEVSATKSYKLKIA